MVVAAVFAASQAAGGDTAAALVPRLLGGSASDFLALFVKDGTATIDDVFDGPITSADFLAFRNRFATRLAEAQPTIASLATLRVTRDAEMPRTAVEQILPLDAGFAWDTCSLAGKANSSAEVLFTVVAELGAAGLLRSVRMYYPSFPITGGGIRRDPILPINASAKTKGAVASYQAALRAGDANAVAACYEPDGYFREPSGTYHTGAREGVLPNFREFFKLGRGGGIELAHTAVTSDGTAFVLEYNCVGWGGVALPPSAGVAGYELGRSGRIMGGRVNDNVVPPPQQQQPLIIGQ